MLSGVAREKLPLLRQIHHVKLSSLAEHTDDEIWASLQALKGKPQVNNERLRTPEFGRRFMEDGYETPGEVPDEGKAFFARRAKLPARVDRVVLATKLRDRMPSAARSSCTITSRLMRRALRRFERPMVGTIAADGLLTMRLAAGEPLSPTKQLRPRKYRSK